MTSTAGATETSRNLPARLRVRAGVCAGRGRSGGVKSDDLGLQVGRDGFDAVEWIATQPWSDGHVFMYGGSFVGMTQWRTAAAASAPSLRNRSLCANLSRLGHTQHKWNPTGVDRRSLGLRRPAARLTLISLPTANYWQGKMLEQYAAYRPFAELDDAVGIARG